MITIIIIDKKLKELYKKEGKSYEEICMFSMWLRSRRR